MNTSRLIVVLALIFAAMPSSAHAEPITDGQIYHWVGVSKSFWGHSLDHCSNGIQITREEVLPDPQIWGTAVLGGCWMALDPQFYPRPADIPLHYWEAAMCHVVVHEYGHLLGYPHGQGIMAESSPVSGVRGCPQYDNYRHAYYANPLAATPVPEVRKKKVKKCVRYKRHRFHKRKCRIRR